MIHFTRAVVLILLFQCHFTWGQKEFDFNSPRAKKTVIPFQFINNLIFIPVTVNGVKLTFLLDTGVDETILFSLEENQQVSLSDVKKIKLIGLGGAQTVEGLKSSGNSITIKGLTDPAHEIYIVLDQGFNFSSNIGIPVNGIIGYHFFKNFPVEIDYDRKRIIVYRQHEQEKPKPFRGFKRFPISIESNKPYTDVALRMKNDSLSAKLLIDLGSSDALWLFPEKLKDFTIPDRNFEDFLGRGLSGDINGRRARVEEMVFCSFPFVNLLAAFPEMQSTQSITMVENRVGSLGAEIFKRFRVIFDYKNRLLYLRKGCDYAAPFHFNMSGIEIHHDGMVWVREQIEMVTVKQGTGFELPNDSSADRFRYKFELKPIYVINSVRKDSPAEQCGLKRGDIIVSINGRAGYRYNLQEMNNLLKSEEGKLIEIEVERANRLMKFVFRLKSII